VSSMSNTSTTGVPRAAFLAARKAWPERGHDDRLADPVRQVYDAWRSVAEADRLDALEAAGSDDFPRLRGGVKDAQITLVEFAQTEVAKFMRANARTVRLSGTAFSRTLEMQRDLADYMDNDPNATKLSLDWVVEFVIDKVVGTARGTFAMSLDTQTSLRLAVSHRLEKAMKVDHLTANPLKAEWEDFVPPLVMKRIEDAAKRNLDLTWALDQASGKQAFSGRHPANSSRGGKAEYARQRGRGGGAPKGAPKGGKGGAGGRGGRGRGRGTSTAPRADSARADASPDE
jgi:hypothetical protein